MASKKQHIVHIVPHLILGGVAKLVLGIALSQIREGHKVSVICLLPIKGELTSAFVSSGIKLHTCRVQWPRRTSFVPQSIQNWLRKESESGFSHRLSRLLKRIKTDIVHTHTFRSIELVAKSVIDECNLPFVWSVHAVYRFHPGPETDNVERAILTMENSRRAMITTDSSLLEMDLLTHFPIAKQFLRVVHPGADTTSFLTPIPKDDNWRKNLGIPERAIVFGSCGRLSPVKGFDIFIKAASTMVKKYENVFFAISGSGESHDELESLISSLGLQSRFFLLGFQEDLPFVLNQFDVFILSSRSEGFPLALIEALTVGLPCIASDVSGIDEMFGESGGIIVPKESPDELIMAMDLMLDPETREYFSNEGRVRGLKFSYDTCASEFLQIYSLLGAVVPKGEVINASN